MKGKKTIQTMPKTHINSPDDLAFDACVDLCQAMLIQTYNDYKYLLVYCRDNKKSYLKAADRIIAYQDYKEEQNKYKDIKKRLKKQHNKVNEITKEWLKEFEAKPRIMKPSKRIYNIYNEYVANKRELDACEWFYKSKRYLAFSLDTGISGEYVMKQAKKEVGIL